MLMMHSFSCLFLQRTYEESSLLDVIIGEQLSVTENISFISQHFPPKSSKDQTLID